MQFTVALIPRYYVIYDLQSMSIQKSAYEDSDSCTDSDVDISSVSSQVPSTHSYPPRNKDKPTQNLLKKNDSFVAQELEESFNMSKNYRKYGVSNRTTIPRSVTKRAENKRYHLRSDNDQMLDSVTQNFQQVDRNPMNQQMQKRVQISKSHGESSFERRTSSPKKKRKRPSYPNEPKSKKQKIQLEDFYQNASIAADGSDTEGIRSTTPAYQMSEGNRNNGRKRKDQGRANTTKEVSKRKGPEDIRSLYNEGYYTDNLNSDSLHQDSEDQYNSDDNIKQKKMKKKADTSHKQKSKCKRDDWSDKALDDFLETLREQPVKEMNDRRNKWIIFAKRLERKGTTKNNDECRKQVYIN